MWAIIFITPPMQEAMHFDCLSYLGIVWTHSINHLNLNWNDFLFLRFPFDWRSPSGYLVAFSLEVVLEFFVCLNCAINLSFAVGSCLFMIAFANDIKSELNALNDTKNPKMRTHQIIKIHSTAIQLSTFFKFIYIRISIFCGFFCRFVSNFTATFKMIYTFDFLWTMITICDTLLMLQMILVQYFYDILDDYCPVRITTRNHFGFSFLVAWFIECIGNDETHFANILVICTNLCVLWYERICYEPFQWNWFLQQMWLVFISNSHTSSYANTHRKHTTTSCGQRIWEYFMYTRDIQKGNFWISISCFINKFEHVQFFPSLE